MPKSLADGRVKLALLSSKPANPAAPTTTELNNGIDISCEVLASAYSFGATDSDKVAEKALCTVANTNAPGASNYVADVTFFRYFASGGAVDVTEDASFQAVMTKGTTAWLYERESGKLSTAAWASTDEVFGAEILTDEPQKPSDQGGYIKTRVPMEVQDAWFGAVA